MFIKTSTRTRAGGGLRARCSRSSTAPRYATLDYTKLFVDQMRRADQGHPRGRRRDFSIVGFGGDQHAPSSAWALKDWAERTRSQAADPAGHPGPRSTRSPACRPSSSRRRRCPAPAAACRSRSSSSRPATPTRSTRSPRQIKNKAQASGQFIVVQNSLAFDAPQVRVTIDRDRAAALGVPVSEIGTTLTSLVGGGSIAQVRPRQPQLRHHHPGAAEYRAQSRRASAQFFVRSVDRRRWCRCRPVVTIETDASPAAIEQFNQLNSATISALPLPGVTTGDGARRRSEQIAQRGDARRLLRSISPASRGWRCSRATRIADRLRARRSSSSIWCSPRSSRASAIRSSS